MMKQESKVLWLSDIHHKCFEYEDHGTHLVTEYYKSIETFINDQKPTHIIITGDCSFSGQMKQYDDLYDKLFKKYLAANPACRFCTIPGNHSVIRNVPLKLLSALDKTDGKDYLKNFHSREELENKLINFKYSEAKEKLSCFYNEEWFTQNDQKWNSKGQIDLFELVFSGYNYFVNKYVLPTLTNENIALYDYDTSSGKYGVIHDIEYNLVFICINSAWYAWGKDTFDELLIKGSNLHEELNEYGNLSLRESTLKSINQTLANLKNSSILQECATILLSHHNMSWISFDQQYKLASEWSELYRFSDLMLYGHIHVPHYPASVYRNQVYTFESPQLFDYHLLTADATEAQKISSTIGFSIFEFFSNYEEFRHLPYQVKENNFVRRLIKGRDIYKFDWHISDNVKNTAEIELEHSYKYLKEKHYKQTFYDFQNATINHFDDYHQKIKSISSKDTPIITFPITDSYSLWIQQLCDELISRGSFNIKENFIYLIDDNQKCHIFFKKISESFEKFALDMDKCISDLKDEDIFNSKLIQFYFGDWELFNTFGSPNYNTDILCLENWFLSWKMELFSKLKSKINSDEHNLGGINVPSDDSRLKRNSNLVKIGIFFAIFKYQEYRKYIIKS